VQHQQPFVRSLLARYIVAQSLTYDSLEFTDVRNRPPIQNARDCNTRDRWQDTMKKSTALNIGLAAISVCLTLLALELAVRIHRGKVLHFQSLIAESQNGVGRMAYHPRLGWLPRPGRVSTGWTSNVDASGVRSNGGSISTTGRPILAVGDSFTFGDEVEDHETWAAHLESLLKRRVLNAGVGAYGIDQAFLRAELLLDQYDPEVVILSFISDDINRTEYSYYPYGRGWKPYFRYRDGALVLQNVPVPQERAPSGARNLETLRRALGFSFLADAVLRRTFPGWWHDYPTIEQVHQDGEAVSVDLLDRLHSLMKARGGRLIVIALATKGRIGGNTRLPNLVKRAREKGMDVLDLSTEVLELPPSELQGLFLPGGHYSPATNRSIAERIATYVE
jgi:hypothetical protein